MRLANRRRRGPERINRDVFDRENVSHLCRQCWGMTTDPECLPKLFSRSGMPKTYYSARNPCRLCLAIAESPIYSPSFRVHYCPIHDSISQEQDSISQSKPVKQIPPSTDFELDCLSVQFGDETRSLKIPIFTTEDDISAPFIKRRPPETDLGSAKAIEMCRRQLQSCLENHRRCRTVEDPLLPTRVIDVGTKERHQICDESVHLRLHVSQKNQRGEYVALSYKWGCEQQLTTKTMNIGNFTNAIDFNALPRTIQDAIMITRGLSIRYLWVDALCIIQDQEIDQSHEIESMGEIYKNSTITVAASNSRGAKDGFLKILKEPRAIETKIRCYRGLGTIWLLPESCMYESTEPLTSRAWAYQEKLLSTRILDYGSQGLIWSCPTESSKSIIPESIRYVTDSRSYALERPGELSVSRFSITKKDELAHLWRKIVESYSWRDAKFHKDRLLAIAGVARQIHELTGATYLAGIWKEAAIKQLCWRHCKEFVGEAQFLPCEPNAPSWSWASVDGGVTFEEGLHNQEASLIGCTMELLRADAPFGNVARGSLTVAAKTVESNGNNHCFFRVYLDVRSTIPTLPITISENQGIQVSIRGILCQAWYMLVGWTQLIRAPPPDTGPHWVERFPIGLILVRLERGEYTRIGFFKYSESRSSYVEIFGQVKPEEITIV